MTENKSYKIQLLRGLSIIAVVFIHNTPKGLYQVWCRPFVNYSVGCFIFLSGLLSTANNWHPWKRIKKIQIPYVIWSFIYVVLYNYKFPKQIPFIFMKQLLTGSSAAVMYYVFVYCEFQLLIPIIDKLAKSKYKWIGFVISPIEIIFMRMIPIICGFEWNLFISRAMSLSCLGWFSYFYLGYLLGNGILEVKISDHPILILIGGGNITNC